MLSPSWGGFFKRAIVDRGLDEGHVPHDESRQTKRARTDDSSHGSREFEFGLMKRTSDTDHSTATFIGSGSGIHFVRAVYNALASDQETTSPSAASDPREDTEGNVVPGEDEHVPGLTTYADRTRLWQSHEVANTLNQSSSLEYDKLLAWSESYWTNWHPMFPFLFAPDVLLWLESIVANGLRQPFHNLNGFKVATVRAIFSIALADRRQEQVTRSQDAVPAILVFDSFENAINSVQRALIDRPSMEALQAIVAVQLFLMSMLRQSAAARLGGLVHSMVYQLGLHRCPVRYPTFSAHEASIRQRLLWSVYCLDRHISQSLGSPLGIRDDDLDVCFLDEEKHAPGSFQTCDPENRLALLNLTSRIFKVKGHILEYCNKSISHRLMMEPDTAVLLSSEIAKVSNCIDDFLDNRPMTDALPATHVLALKVLKQECVISLNRPLLARAKQNSSYQAGLQVCVGASRVIINTLYSRSTDGNAGAAVPLLFPSFTWAVWMSAFIVVYAAVEGEMPISTSKLLVARSIGILKDLSLRGSFWPNACATAIRDLHSRLEQVQTTTGKNKSVGNASSRPRYTHTTTTFPTHATPPGTASANDIAGGYIKSPEMFQERHSDSSGPPKTAPPRPEANGQDDPSASGANQGLRGALLDSVQGAPNPGIFPTMDETSSFDLFDGFEIPFWMGEDNFDLEWPGNG